MSMSIRTIKVQGQSLSAHGTVTVDAQTVWQGEFLDGVLYQFETPVSRHGFAPVEIDLDHGQLLIQKIVVTYPACIRSNLGWLSCLAKRYTGYYTFDQPIARAMVDCQDQFINLPVLVNNKLHYRHLMFNGPSYWNVTVKTGSDMCHGMEINHSDWAFVSRREHWDYDFVPFTPGSVDDELALLNCK